MGYSNVEAADALMRQLQADFQTMSLLQTNMATSMQGLLNTVSTLLRDVDKLSKDLDKVDKRVQKLEKK